LHPKCLLQRLRFEQAPLEQLII